MMHFLQVTILQCCSATIRHVVYGVRCTHSWGTMMHLRQRDHLAVLFRNRCGTSCTGSCFTHSVGTMTQRWQVTILQCCSGTIRQVV